MSGDPFFQPGLIDLPFAEGRSAAVVEDRRRVHGARARLWRLCAVLVAAGTCLFTDCTAGHAAEPAVGKGKAVPKVGPTGTAVAEHHILVFTNETRAKNKLPPLKESEALAAIARNHSEHMCEAGSLLHESGKFPKGWGRFYERLKRANVTNGAENIAYVSLGKDAKAWAKTVVEGWMQSPRHRKQILDGRFRYLGVGVKLCPDRLGYATQVFSPEPGRLSRASESDARKRSTNGQGKTRTVN